MHPRKFLGRDKDTLPSPISDERKFEHLASISTALAGKRKEAVDARRASGIETIWLNSEEAYLGIDDMNRHEFADAKWAKPTSITGPLTSKSALPADGRSNAFVRLTSRYVDFATAKVCEGILPIDDKAFSFEATPNPDLVKRMEDLTPIMTAAGTPVMRKMTEDELPQPQQGQPQPQGAQDTQQVQVTPADIAKKLIDSASESAKKAETRIYGWMVECKYTAEARKVVADAARIGTGVLKGPIPEIKKSRALTVDGDKVALKFEKKVIPGTTWVDVWNLFPDDACGEDVHNGDGIFERDYLATKMLKRLKEDPSYLKKQIDLVLEEGPGKIYADGANPHDKQGNKKRFEIWYYYGTMSRADMEMSVASPDIMEGIDADKEDVNVIISMVNDTIIRVIANPTESGAFPYRVFTWSRRPGHWAGVGVGEQISMPQRMCNASTRAMLNNAGLSSGPQIIINQVGIIPADGSWTLTPNKIWYMTEEGGQDVTKAFLSVDIANAQVEMMSIIQYAMQLAEESSSIPLVTQGQSGPNDPETFGQAELQNDNAHTWLRSICLRYDDLVTEPLIDDYYDWLLMDPDVPDDEKGDFNINAHGSLAMVERALQEKTYAMLLTASANPAFDLDPSKLMANFLRAKRLNPADCQLSDADKEKRDKQPPPPAPAIEVAQIRAKVDSDAMVADAQIAKEEIASKERIAQMSNETEHLRIQTDTDRDTAYVNAENEQSRIAAAAAENKRQDDYKLAIAKLANDEKITLDEAKTRLTETAMKLRTQTELSAAALTVDIHKHKNPAPVITPPTEPAGRAADGQSYAQ